METYIGVKIIEAEPCRYFEFLEKYKSKVYRDTIQPKREDQEGYLVKYPDGYISWSPKETFEEAYFEVDKNKASEIRESLKSQLQNM